ncbi:acyl-CoA-like ligand-binding transcription factor [Actinocorallia populi]|uniref:acyl-CoA-like ligand-binding transcription factor n=1 Tax=Actinocorallia populi TaxID=2079200 RepID=UPI001300B54A|nr:hypothetical protein [Actinocorallia populi]
MGRSTAALPAPGAEEPGSPLRRSLCPTWLDTRPPHEPDWDCLRRTFDVVVEVLTDEKGRAHDLAVQQIVQECPALHAAHLERADRLQEQMAERLSARAVARDPACRPDPVVLRAVVGAAFACLLSAVSHALRDGDLDGLGARLDRVMEALRPSSAEPPAASRPS